MIKYTKIVHFDIGTERPATEYCEQLEADRETLVRYVRAVTSWANEQMDIFKERDVMKKREYEESYDALSQELREEINE